MGLLVLTPGSATKVSLCLLVPLLGAWPTWVSGFLAYLPCESRLRSRIKTTASSDGRKDFPNL